MSGQRAPEVTCPLVQREGYHPGLGGDQESTFWEEGMQLFLGASL